MEGIGTLCLFLRPHTPPLRRRVLTEDTEEEGTAALRD